MSVKVIVTDMDGTFLNDAKTYNQPRFMAQYQELKNIPLRWAMLRKTLNKSPVTLPMIIIMKAR